MSDNLMTPLAWQTFCNRVAQKLGDEVAPEDVIDLVRELEPDEVFDVDQLRTWAYDNL